jgi:glycosyltransferase involved in cell wall biosynthesis
VSSVGDVAIVHDYITQRGGAERVVLALAAAFPGAPIHTSLYDLEGTFPEFGLLDVRPMPIDRIGPLRRHHRMALPLFAPSFSALTIRADVAVCSSSGWAHGAHVTGRKVVYCHTPARWLYQSERYLAGFGGPAGLVLGALKPGLRSWDKRAAASAHRYLVNSTVVQTRVAELYGIDAEIVPAPVGVDPSGPAEPVPTVESGFFLCVSRLLSYKNVGAVVAAFSAVPERQLVVVGTGPMHDELVAAATPNVRILGRVTDGQLRWLYREATGLIAASYEDFGLTPVEAAAYGTPTVALRWGGFLDTIVEGRTGVFFDEPEPGRIATAVRELAAATWPADVLMTHAEVFSPARFAARLQAVVAEEAGAQ